MNASEEEDYVNIEHGFALTWRMMTGSGRMSSMTRILVTWVGLARGSIEETTICWVRPIIAH
jgi:hypothetical protein